MRFWITLLLASAWLTSGGAGGREPGPTPPWDNSRLQGSPEPPRPYTVQRAFPRLQLDWPVCLRAVPGQPYYLAINETGPYSPCTLRWFADSPEAEVAAELIAYDNLAYGIAFHPRFPENGYVYLGLAQPDHPSGARCVIMRYTLQCDDGVRIVAGSEREIIAWSSNGHNGAALAFAPDGLLFVTTGDGTVRRDTDEVGQRLDTLRSKVLRIDVDHPAPGQAYSVPADNPFVDTPGARPETWCYGLRNPWRISVDPPTGQVWVGNNGQDAWEQAYLIQPGANYGWSVYEGGHLFIADRQPGPTPISPPTFEHPHSEARSLTGGLVYRGPRLEALQGAYLYGDYATGKIWAGRLDNSEGPRTEEIADTPLNITCFTAAPDGELLIADHRGQGQGGFYRLIPNPDSSAAAAFPLRLSQTGLFADCQRLLPAAGVHEYFLNHPAWHDGATSRSWIAVPAREDAPHQAAEITFRPDQPWEFPDGTALAQTLWTPLDDPRLGRPRRLETRILLKQQGEWAAYSYLWNAEQSDAELAPAAGAESPLVTGLFPADPHLDRWRIPARSACMGCHSRAANYVLGVRTEQLLRDLPEVNGEPAAGRQLGRWRQLGLLPADAPVVASAELDRLPALTRWPPPTSPWKDRDELERRARQYLHVNCSHCHVPDGGGNARLVLTRQTPLAETQLLGQAPLHGRMGLAPGDLLTPGRPEASVTAFRLASTGGARMPRIGSHVVDVEGLRLIRHWIASLAPEAAAASWTAAADRLRRGEASVGDALLIAFAADDGQLDAATLAELVPLGGRHAEPAVRDVFERFLPPDQRQPRLGPSPDPAAILAVAGDAERGGRLFHQSQALACRSCHRIAGAGRSVGPDLDGVGKKYSSAQILQQILDPSREIAEPYAAYLVATQAGRVYSGLLLRRTPEQLTLQQASGESLSLSLEDVETLQRQARSIMPDQLLKDLTAQQAADLVAYLKSLQ